MAEDRSWDDDQDEDEDENDDGELDEPDPDLHRVLTFSAGARLFGLRIGQVSEIAEIPAITPIPESPSWMPGVAALRGRIVPLIDLRERLKLEPPPDWTRPCLVVTEGGDFPLGLVLDEVRDVVSIPPERLAPPPTRGGLGFVIGIGNLGGQVMILIDPRRLLDATEQRFLAAAIQAAVEHSQLESFTPAAQAAPGTDTPAALRPTRDERF